MIDPLWALVVLPALPVGVAGVLYPAVLRRVREDPRPSAVPRSDLPIVSVVIAAYNAERTIAPTLEQVLRSDYPSDRLQIVVVSDGSTDRTDDIVLGFRERGVDLLRVPRGGKTAAENRAIERVRGEIVVCTDASVIMRAAAIRALVRRLLSDPTLGVASGRSIVVSPQELDAAADHALESANPGGHYAKYVHGLRTDETKLGAIVGATGGLYAQRRAVFAVPLPPCVTRDMACTFVAHELGLGSAQENDAVCIVAHAASLRIERKRKVRTMINGLDTLWYFRRLLNPMRSGRFALQIWAHKCTRYAVYPALLIAIAALAALAPSSLLARVMLVVGAAGVAAGVAALCIDARALPRPLAALGFITAAVLAGIKAWWSFLRGRHAITWEPTRRTVDPIQPEMANG